MGFATQKNHPNFGRSSEIRGRGEFLLLGVVSSPEGILLKIHPSIVSSRWVNFSFAGKKTDPVRSLSSPLFLVCLLPPPAVFLLPLLHPFYAP